MREKLLQFDTETKRLDDFYDNVLGTQVDRMTSIQKEVRSIATEFHIDPESIDYSSQETEGGGMTLFQITIPLEQRHPAALRLLRRIVDRLRVDEIGRAHV